MTKTISAEILSTTKTLLAVADSRMPTESSTLSPMTKSAATTSHCECARSQLDGGSTTRRERCRLDCCAQSGSDSPTLFEHVLNRGRELLRDRRGADAVLEDQRESDDPREELAERRVRVRVGAAGDRHHRAQFGVAQRREERREAGEQIGDDDGGTGALDAGADRREDAAADHRSEADGDQILGRQRAPKDLARSQLAQLRRVGRGEELARRTAFGRRFATTFR